MLFSNKSIIFIIILSFIGINSQTIKENNNKFKKTYSCTKWSKWNDIEGLKKELLEIYPDLKVNIGQSSDICEIFNLEKFIREETPKKKSRFNLGIAKTAGLASCLGLTFAIAGAIAYSKRNDEDEMEELINNHLESEQS